MTPTPSSPPSDHTTLQAVLAGSAGEGFVGVFELVGEDGDLRCADCSSVVTASNVPVHSIRRLEGASDPADMLAVCAITCPSCGSRGAVVVHYGPMASVEEAEFLSRARDHRSDDVVPPDAAPGEASGAARVDDGADEGGEPS